MSGDQMQQGGEGIQETEGNARRDFLKKAGIAGAVAWTAPTLLSTAAHAQGTSNPNIIFVGAGAEVNTTRAFALTAANQTLQVPVPAGRQAGDLLMVVITTNGSSTVAAVPGWTEISAGSVTSGATTTQSLVRVATATGSEPATIAFTRNVQAFSTGGIYRIVMVAYRNVASLGADAVTNQTAQTTHTFPSVNTTIPNSVVVRFGTSQGGAATWSTATSPYTQRHNSGNADRGHVIFDSAINPFGASGTASLGISASRDAVRHSVVLNALP
jgi:hypothetical protein